MRSFSSTGTGTHCSRLDAGDKRAPPLVDMTRRGLTSALATVSNPARTTRICAVCESSDCHCHQAGGGPGGGHENIQIYSAHEVEVPARVAGSTKERVARPVVDPKRRRPRAAGLRVRPKCGGQRRGDVVQAQAVALVRQGQIALVAGNRQVRAAPPEPPIRAAGAGDSRALICITQLLRLKRQARGLRR